MSENPYWEEIEQYFVKKRGNALILSPKDWPLVASWQERGIPLEVIYEGIDQAFTRLEEKQQTSQRQTALTLAYCQYTIEDLWKARKTDSQKISQSPEEDSHNRIIAERQKLSAKIRSISDQLCTFARDPHYHCIHEALLTSSKALDSRVALLTHAEDITTISQIKQQIRNIEKSLLSQLEQTIDEDIRQQFYAKAEAQLASYKQNMSKEVYQETLRIAFLRTLREAYPLPSFL